MHSDDLSGTHHGGIVTVIGHLHETKSVSMSRLPSRCSLETRLTGKFCGKELSLMTGARVDQTTVQCLNG